MFINCSTLQIMVIVIIIRQQLETFSSGPVNAEIINSLSSRSTVKISTIWHHFMVSTRQINEQFPICLSQLMKD